MSLDYLQVRKNRTSVRAPGTEIDSANSVGSNTGVELGRGWEVNNVGQVSMGVYPSDSATTNSFIVVGSGDTVSNSAGLVRLSCAAAVTGLLMQSGSRSGQIATIMNCANTTMVFAAVATSKVHGGTNNTIGAYSVAQFMWDNVGVTQMGTGAGWHRLG